MFSFPTDPSNPSHFYRINEFSGCAPVFPAKRRGGRNGCCSATKAVIARTFVLLSEGCRRRRETRGPRLASPTVVRTKAAPLFFLEEAMHIVYFASPVQGWGKSAGSERSGVERSGEERKKKGCGKKTGKERGEKSCWRASKGAASCTRTRFIVPKKRIFLQRFRAVAKEIHR